MVLVTCRSEAGEWAMWRVGRRRLAWLPGNSRPPQGLDFFTDCPITAPAVVILVFLCLAVSWICCLLATMVVWPVRVLVARWLVVAYPVVGDGSPGFRRRIRGRAEADALARQWAAEIEDHGRPQVPATTPDDGHA
ncbi:hypothetical protein QLQ12_00045 [Actinoplanes sp. NEAU-A12]|uniref:Uncharacterized protein n=1 Tax=Actinoplanes sandaracinus TaxID=3045177 RepID=A0ABT6WB98_9ACTN|nr:hypothetical protein [Actinoplanes sandaracinus]MDI6096996.1 hypothetical protein [Actinoplanes sandaracinus]